MKLYLIPQRRDADLAVSVQGDVLTLNGVSFDLTGLLEGETLPGSAVGPDSLLVSATRAGGQIAVHLVLPYGTEPIIDPMVVVALDDAQGAVAIPGHTAEQPPVVAPGAVDWDQRVPAPDLSAPTQRELDQRRYQRRASVRDSLISWMAADNMDRVRTGVWSVSDLVGLMSDPAVQAAQAYMSMLSFELAAQAISAATSPLLTPAIKAAWTEQLTAHYYLEG
jgi:hypothetical protein